MIYSMTAFGRARKDTEERSVTAEIKSVNNRFLDISVKLPRLFGYLEEKVKSRITERGISRGKIDVNISIDVLSNDGVEVFLDKAYTDSYIKALKKILLLLQILPFFQLKKQEKTQKKNGELFFPFLTKQSTCSSLKDSEKATI